MAADLDRHGDRVRPRALVIAAEPELADRESAKVRAWTAALARCLTEDVDDGIDEPGAWLLAEVGMAVFRSAYRQWIAAAPPGDLTALLDTAIDDAARTVTAMSIMPSI